MRLSAGTRLGPYQIVSLLGAGGMGDVYRAHDPRLGRDIAIKSLPELSVADPERVGRFQREAQILAALNHPHIAALYGLEEVGGSQFLILELVEGETLARRLKTGPLPLLEALTIARQVADALEAAHDKSIIHRDLKPANVVVRSDGQAKVLDFGLAKALDPDPSSNIVDSPTMTSGATRVGVVLGTAAYMSPEQARGRPLDKRTDIWAFGCVLFEMLTGRLTFPGETISDSVAAILEREPDWRLLPATTPARIQWLLRRCLEKDPKRRLHDIADARIEIDEALSHPSDTGIAVPAVSGDIVRARRRERVAWLVAAGGLAAVAGLLILSRTGSGNRTTDVRTYSTSIVLPDGVSLWTLNPPGRFAISPDGRRLALVASDSTGRSMLWVRPLHSRVALALGGTEGATYPFWSADSRNIAFLAQKTLKKIDASGGEVVTLCPALFAAPGAWNRDGVILFTPNGNSPLYRVSASAGTPVPATTLDAASGDVQHSYPFFLPDGRHFLYFVVGTKTGRTVPRGVYVGSLDSRGPDKLILEDGLNAKYANGHLIYLRAGALLAQPFDVDRLEPRGQAVSVVERVQASGGAISDVAGAFTVSQTGVLAYQTESMVRTQLTWFDRAGIELGKLGDQAEYLDVALSPDDSRVAVSVMDQGTRTEDVWIFDVARRLRDRFTFEASDDFGANWSRPGGDRIFFSSQRKDRINLYEKRSSGPGSEALLLEDDLGKYNGSASSNGQVLMYVAGGGIIGRSDIWVLPLTGDKKPYPFLETESVESQGQFSPDGRWVAFMSRKSGLSEVYVTPFPGRETEQRISTAGGSLPRWNRNGKEIFYLAADNMLVATPVNGEGPRFEVGAGRPLFLLKPRLARLDAYPYDVTSDGQRILVNTFVEEVSPPITLIVNWSPSSQR